MSTVGKAAPLEAEREDRRGPNSYGTSRLRVAFGKSSPRNHEERGLVDATTANPFRLPFVGLASALLDQLIRPRQHAAAIGSGS